MSEVTLEAAQRLERLIERNREPRRIAVASLREEVGAKAATTEEWRLGLWEGRMYALEWVLRELRDEDHSQAVAVEFYPQSNG